MCTQDLVSPPKSVFERGTLHTLRYMKRCLEARTIGVLDLSSFNLATLPPEVTDLTNLTYLKLDTNRFAYVHMCVYVMHICVCVCICVCVYDLTNLTYLKLDTNRFAYVHMCVCVCM